MTKYFINERVLFTPDEHKLTPLGVRGREVVLHTPVSRFLLLLLSKGGAVVSQDEIYREVWEKYGQRVTSNTLYQNVSLLRKAIKTAGITTLTIKTHPKSGFSFCGSIMEAEDDESQSVVPLINNPEEERSNISDIALADATEAHTEVKITEEFSGDILPERKRKFRVTVLFFILFCLAMAFFVLMTSSGTDDHFTMEQNIVGRVNSCPVYVDRGNSKVALSKIMTYLREQNISCEGHDFLYMAKVPNVNEIMIMTCNNEDDDFRCRLLMKLPAYLTPEPKN